MPGFRRITPGMRIDGFHVVELAHRGGMAQLYAVTHPDHDMPLLMKVPETGGGTDPAMIVGFEMEQMILPRLSGPHVPRFVANGDFSRQPYIVFERLPGQSLYPRLDHLPLPPSDVADLGAKIATALADIHRQDVVHLDVKPSNVMFRESGEAVMVDYGLARHLHLPDLMDEEFRLPYGTAPYMAPEQILGVRCDPRSDLFALGVLMYFFSTGRRPFGDPQRMRGLKKRLWRDPRPPRALRPDIPKPLQEIILRCLEVDPARRHPTAAQLAMDLQDLSRVPLTLRAEKTRRDGWAERLKRRFNPDPIELLKPQAGAGMLASAPIVMVAIDLSAGSEELAEALRVTARHVMETTPNARVACFNVLKINRISLDSDIDETGTNKHVARLAQLRHWAEPLNAPEGSVTHHVIEAVSPADAILDFARENLVDHIVMGARANSAMRSLLGSVSGAVAAHAPCTVTVVRSRAAAGET
ncbi:bifunctional serine/threonine-protein kinase/universal stress protein [Pseudomonas sp. R2.Fl]|nr:bifunctional serine/threonine-protein kinase/universal stress protein [Pseudomonas sp. R2.Fl]